MGSQRNFQTSQPNRRVSAAMASPYPSAAKIVQALERLVEEEQQDEMFWRRTHPQAYFTSRAPQALPFRPLPFVVIQHHLRAGGMDIDLQALQALLHQLDDPYHHQRHLDLSAVARGRALS